MEIKQKLYKQKRSEFITHASFVGETSKLHSRKFQKVGDVMVAQKRWLGKLLLLLALMLLFVVLIQLSVPFASASVINGTVILHENQTGFEPNANATGFNFTNQTRTLASMGHIFIINRTDGQGLQLHGRNGARVMNLGMLMPANRSGGLFNDTVQSVPNISHSNFFGEAYTTEVGIWDMPDDLIAVAIPVRPGDTNGTYYYAAMYINSTNMGRNISFIYKFNDRANQTTFGGTLSGCAAHNNFQTCLANIANNCEWMGGFCLAQTGEKFNDAPKPDCGMFPQYVCNRLNSSFCTWDTALGTAGFCKRGTAYHDNFGFNCTTILNDTICANQTFTEMTGLCSWKGNNATPGHNCTLNITKTWIDVPRPPVFTCDAPGYSNNQANCTDLAQKYFLPCLWNTTTSKCTSASFDHTQFNNFDDIGSLSTCEMMGGSWKNDTTYNPATGRTTTENWCEYGFDVQPFSAIGGGGGTFKGSIGRMSSCTESCFGCEYNSTGVQWPSTSVASTQCNASAAGCRFDADSNAFNGQGWCEPAHEFGGYNCKMFCGDCNLEPNPKHACLNVSGVGCKWDNLTGFCIDSSVKTCDQECNFCFNQATCGNSTASGGCNWDGTIQVCSPKGGNYEICYDGYDNNNDGKTDCADPLCGSDAFCGGGEVDTANCFKYSNFTYGGGAQANCTAVTGCTWMNDTFGARYCSPVSDECFTNASFKLNAATCNNFNGGNTCTFESDAQCGDNQTLMRGCFAMPTAVACALVSGCLWDSTKNFCDLETFVRCDNNLSLQTSQSTCQAANCTWLGGSYGSTFEGFARANCASPCGANTNLTTQSTCQNVSKGSVFTNGTCQWTAGFCEPTNFIGGCADQDGDLTACRANSKCTWTDEVRAPVKNLSGGSGYNERFDVPETWLAMGVQRPVNGTNVSIYNLSWNLTNNNSTISLVISRDFWNTSVPGIPMNTTRLYCNSTVIMEFNWTTGTCVLGSCNTYNITTCSGKELHYFFRNNTIRTEGELEALWEINYSKLTLDGTNANTGVTSTANTTTVTINGNISEQVKERSNAGANNNVSRIRIGRGLCNDALSNTFFKEFQDTQPEMIARDTINGTDDPAHDYLDISGIGVKKTDEAYMYGIPVSDMGGSSLCDGAPLKNNMVGTGANTSKYYLYLDTNGVTTGGCAAYDNTTIVGFEYLFKYIAQTDATGKLSEELLSMNCMSSKWSPTNVPLKSNQKKACNIIGGPLFGIDKGILSGKSDVSVTTGWRAYATTANSSGNATNIVDRVSVGMGDFSSIDVDLVDCMSQEDKDNAQCGKFKKFGFFPGEFGPACKDGKDNDNDDLTDCDDFDCKYDPFFCGGSFIAIGSDSTAPNFVANKINTKLPNALSFIYGTDEPSNGSVLFYGTDTNCGTLNTSYSDKALNDGINLTNYRPHHTTDIAGLALNTTYFYKVKTCDPTDNCAISKCKNASTAAKATNITFKLVIPTNWVVDIPNINLTNYTARYSLKAPSNLLSNMTMFVRTVSNNTNMEFKGVDIFEKQTLNISGFVTGTNLLALDANQYQNFKQRTGVDEVKIKVPGTGTTLKHCDDDGANCATVTSGATCTFGTDNTQCTIPDAVGLGFSGYGPSGGGSGGSAGGGGGGGGGGVSKPAPKGPLVPALPVAQSTKPSIPLPAPTAVPATEENVDTTAAAEAEKQEEQQKETAGAEKVVSKGAASKMPGVLKAGILLVVIALFLGWCFRRSHAKN